MVKLINRGGVIYAHYTYENKRIRRSLNLPYDNKNLAYAYREIVPKLEERLRSGLSLDMDIRLKAYLQRGINKGVKKSSALNMQSRAKTIISLLGNKEITDYRIADIKEFVKALQKKKLKNSTIKNYISDLRVAFKEAISDEIIIRNPCTVIELKIEKSDKKPFDIFKVARVLQKAKGSLKTFLFMAFYTGARAGEILALTWKDIDFENNLINISKNKAQATGEVTTTKTGESRQTFLLAPLKEYLLEIRGDSKGSIIKSGSYVYFNNLFTRLQRELGYKEIYGTHIARHTYISMLLKQKVDITLIQKQVGHKSLNMIMNVYAHNIPDEQDKVKLDNALSAWHKLGTN